MRLYLNSGSDYSIVDDNKKRYAPAEARALYEAGKVADFNLAFRRLITEDFSLDAVKEFYRSAR